MNKTSFGFRVFPKEQYGITICRHEREIVILQHEKSKVAEIAAVIQNINR